LKRGINGTYVSIEPFHLFCYLDEQSFRYNNRKNMDLPQVLSQEEVTRLIDAAEMALSPHPADDPLCHRRQVIEKSRQPDDSGSCGFPEEAEGLFSNLRDLREFFVRQFQI
jgi:hypothetical protein